MNLADPVIMMEEGRIVEDTGASAIAQTEP
jgi:hypothetical protein